MLGLLLNTIRGCILDKTDETNYISYLSTTWKLKKSLVYQNIYKKSTSMELD